jgi:DENN domain-containing protein 5
MLSLPQGLRFKTQKHELLPRFHSFASTRDDGKRCYGFSLVFYEEVKNENICTAMQTLQSMYITELSSSQGSLRKSDSVSRSLPRHFRLADEDDKNGALSFYDITKDTLYVTKSITLVCQFAYAHVAEIFLTNLYKCLPRSPGARLSLESYIYNILYDVKVPEMGKSIRIYLPPEQPNMSPINIILQRNKSTELPSLDFPLRILFDLGVELVVELFTSVLLENQVLLISDDFNKLTIVAQCITFLLFPFEWSHVFAPVLPTALSHYLLAPMPYIMGVHSESADANTQKAGLCYLDIDSKTIQIPEEQSSFPHKHELIDDIYEILAKYNLVDKKEQLPTTSQNEFDSTILNPKNLMMNNNFYFQPPPSSNDKFSTIHYQRLSTSPATTLTLTKSRRKKHSLHDYIEFDSLGTTSTAHHKDNLTSTSRSSSSSKREPLRTNEQYYNDLQLNAELQEIFFNRFCQIFIDYEQFVILPNQSQEEWLKNRESLHNFDKASFLSDQPSHYRLFFAQFLESQMFATLIDNKIMTSFGEKSTSSGGSGGGSKSTADEAHLHCNKNLQLFDNRIKILK